MRQAAGALLRQGWKHSAGSSSRVLSHSLRKQWLACIPAPPSSSRIPPVQSFHAAHFSSAAAVNNSSKENRPVEDKAETEAGKSGKKDAQVSGSAENGGKGGEETTEQKLVKEIKQLEQQLREKDSLIEEKDDIVKELKDNVLRGYAELENYRDRARREQESSRKFAIQSFSKDILDVSDNLMRALCSVGQPKDAEEAKKTLDTLLEGVKMTEKQLTAVLKKYGIEGYNPTGQPFDPNVHLAVCEVHDPGKPAGTVACCFKLGYLLHERVLRPAEVAVVKAVEAAA